MKLNELRIVKCSFKKFILSALPLSSHIMMKPHRERAQDYKYKNRRLWDDPDKAVNENLLGIAMIHTGLIVLENSRAILRKDYDNMPGKVKLISGGGSGNEPTHLGFVGPGMLTAAISGNIATAPPSTAILEVIEELGTNHPPGILLIVQNYSGYRINFSLALSRAQNKGFNVRMILVEDDSSLKTYEQTAGKRGLAGTIFIHKVAGAMAEEGRNLNDICTTCERIINNGNVATFGVCIKPNECMQSIFEEIGLGSGIHGEPSISQMSFISMQQLTTTMLNTILETNSDDIENVQDFKKFHSGDKIAVIINNLGGCSDMESNIFTLEVLKQLSLLEFNIERVYAGSLMTSLKTNGFHISLLNLSSDVRLVHYLDASTCAPAWPKILNVKMLEVNENDQLGLTTQGKYCKVVPADSIPHMQAQGLKMSERTEQVFLIIITFACEALIACTDQLNIMDEDSGDGDCGTVLNRGANAIKLAIKENKIIGSNPFTTFSQMSYIVERTMGGSQGGLYSVFFDAAAKVFTRKQNDESISGHTWLAALTAGNNAISKVGRASLGDRTMLDALIPAQYKLAEVLNMNLHPIRAFAETLKVAEHSAMQTIYMQAACGRASLLKEKVFKYPDPGAHAVHIWMRAAYEAFKLKLNYQCEM